MKSLQRKCFVASAVTHTLLLVMLLVGSAFVPHKPPADDSIAIQLVDIPDILVDEPNVVGGGNPRAGLPNVDPVPVTQAPSVPTPAPKPEPPAPEPVKQPIPEPAPAKPEKKLEPEPPPKPEPNPFNLAEAKTIKSPAPAPKPAENKPAFDLGKAERKVIKPAPSRSPTSASSEAARESSAAAAREAKIASAAGAALANLSKGLSTGVGEIGIPGPGGAAYASYGLALRKIYYDAWIPPAAAGDGEPIVQVEVVIARDGKVLSSRILKRSGKRELDRSVQETLNRVKKVREFPSGSSDEKRTYQIHFDLSNRQSYG
jgi:colicin import membrane protein